MAERMCTGVHKRSHLKTYVSDMCRTFYSGTAIKTRKYQRSACLPASKSRFMERLSLPGFDKPENINTRFPVKKSIIFKGYSWYKLKYPFKWLSAAGVHKRSHLKTSVSDILFWNSYTKKKKGTSASA